MTIAARRRRRAELQALTPPSAIVVPLVVGAIATVAGATAFATLAEFAGFDRGGLGLAVGAAIGAAMVRSGGHGMVLGTVACLLALAAIGSGWYCAFQVRVTQEIGAVTTKVCSPAFANRHETAQAWMVLVEDAKRMVAQHGWKGSGEDPWPYDVITFAREHGLQTRSSDEFLRTYDAALRHLARGQIDADALTAEVAANVRRRHAFRDFLMQHFGPWDWMLSMAGLAAPFVLLTNAARGREAAIRKQMREAAKNPTDVAIPGGGSGA